MTIDSQQYANLVAHGYGVKVDGKKGQMEHMVGQKIDLEGVTYKVLEYMDKPSGYQGAIYQRVDTGEVVVVHRGTEFDREPFKDGAITDGRMATQRSNLQADDAIELTRHALKYAEQEGMKPGGHTPEVTVAGHSLGGVLAQITAHKFNLHGETFNAYGAASLGYHIPEGGHQVINHVKAADPVSAASHHFGEVRMYASDGDVESVGKWGGYDNDRNSIDIRNPTVAIIASGGAHRMHHFTNEDSKGKPDCSILADPNARQLAAEYKPMFENYRNDIHALRAGVSVASDVRLEAKQIAGQIAGHNLHAAGYPIEATTRISAEQSRTATYLAGAVAATGVHHAGNAAAGSREAAAAVEAKIDHLQGQAQKSGAAFGADVLRGIGNLLPDGGEKWIDSKADRLQQAGDQAQQRNQNEATAARQSGREDAAVIRQASQTIQSAATGAAARVGDFQHATIAGTGQRLSGTLEVGAYLIEAGTRRPTPHLEQAAQKEVPQAGHDSEKEAQPKNAPATTSPQASALSLQMDRLLAAGQNAEWSVFRRETQSLANGDAGHAMRSQASVAVDQQEQQATRQLAAQQPMQQEAPVMRHMR